MGYFLLGSTCPDIRAITRKRREDYHFAPLDFDTVGAGVQGLFNKHPRLQASSAYNGRTRAFVAGYITHLIADETWIVDMYRPFFGNAAVFADGVTGQVMDRALQLELDRQAWHTVDATRALLEKATSTIDVDFIPDKALADWREWVLTFPERGFSWDRLRFMARRVAAGDENHPAHEVANRFVQAMPESLESLFELVPRGNLADFNERTVEVLIDPLGDYLQ